MVIHRVCENVVDRYKYDYVQEGAANCKTQGLYGRLAVKDERSAFENIATHDIDVNGRTGSAERVWRRRESNRKIARMLLKTCTMHHYVTLTFGKVTIAWGKYVHKGLLPARSKHS
jgi:hypothetical protein